MYIYIYIYMNTCAHVSITYLYIYIYIYMYMYRCVYHVSISMCTIVVYRHTMCIWKRVYTYTCTLIIHIYRYICVYLTHIQIDNIYGSMYIESAFARPSPSPRPFTGGLAPICFENDEKQ